MAEEKKQYIKARGKRTKFNQYPLKEEVLKLLQQSNFRRPTFVQAESLPITLQENLRDLCIIIYAYNGAGKTLTYLIPILNSIQMIPFKGIEQGAHKKQKQISRPQALIILPTQALMSQVYEYLQAFADFYQSQYKWPLIIGRKYGGDDKDGHIIVGMTKKMTQYVKNSSKVDFSQLKWVIFDECDKIKEDLQEDFRQILKLFSDKSINISSANFLITSATGDKNSFRQFIQDNLTSHNILQLDSKDQNKGLVGITHYFSLSKNKDKVIFSILQRLAKLQAKPQVIIFFNQIKQLWTFYNLLKNQTNLFVVNDSQADSKGKNNINVDYIHGRCSSVCFKGPHNHPEDCSRSKTARVDKLRNQQIQVLLGTETIGRGVDIRTVSLVINYSEPKKGQDYNPITYIHRVGRTGRYSDQGIALTFVQDDVFIKLTEADQKIKFEMMKSQQQIIDQALSCSKKNQKVTEQNATLRWEND